MTNVQIGAILILIGSSAAIFRRQYAQFIIDFQNGIFGFKFGKREVLVSKYLALLVGIIFIVVGVASFLGKIKWNH